jgi:CRISPR-associated protein Cas5h
MWGLEFKLDTLYFASFRRPASTSLVLTYITPPYTTLRGLISNALGMKRDDYSIQDWIKIGISSPANLNKSREMAKILKLKGTGDTYTRTFPSSPIFREFLIAPRYRIWVAGEKEQIYRIYDALVQPERPLYLGTSDDLVDVEASKPEEIDETKAKQVIGIVGGIHENCRVENIPYKFIKVDKDFSIEYKTVSIPSTATMSLREEIACWKFHSGNVWLA